MKKKLLALVMAVIMIVSLAACGGGKTNDEVETIPVYVSAAASMTESLDEIIAAYEAANEGIDIIPTYDSSGTLKTQIEAGADCDIFISAAQKQMDGLEEGGFVDTATRVDILENKCALVVAADSTKGIDSWEAFEAAIKGAKSSDDIVFCMGNADVPVGQYTSAILKNLGLDEADMVSKGIVTYGTNVKEVTSQVLSGAADCGIIYATDAFSAGMEVIATADPALTDGQVIYPAAVMANSAQAEAAKAFLDYLQSSEAMAVFEGVGFSAYSA